MDENWEKQLPKPEVVDNKANDNQQESTIEDAIKQKLPDNTDKQQLFLNILKDPRIVGVMSSTDIIGYIQQKNLSRFGNTLKTKNSQEQVQLLMEDMDLYHQSITGTFENISVLEGQIDNSNIQADNLKVWADNLKVWVDNLNTQKSVAELFLAAKDAYAQLDKSKYPEPTADEIDQQKGSISPDTQKKLEAEGKTVEEYTKFLIVEKKYGDQLRYEKNNVFLNSMEDLRKKLWDSTSLSILSDPNKADILVRENLGLKTYANTSPHLGSIWVPKLPESEWFDSDFTTYVKFIPDTKIRESIQGHKELIQKFSKLSEKEQKDDTNREGRKAYEEYVQAITEVQNWLPNITQNITKWGVMSSCIAGLAKYFDTTTINQENFGNDSDLHVQEGFKIQKGEKQYNEQGDDVLAIKGNINGNQVGFYYNLNNPDAQLKSEDYLHYNRETNALSFGVAGGGQNELGVQLPTITMLSEQAQAVSESNFSTLLNSSASLEEFEKALREQVSAKLLQNYGQETRVKTRVERDVEKNISAQTLQKTFVPQKVLEGMNSDDTIQEVWENNARQLFTLRDKSTENMRSDELRILRSLVSTLDLFLTKKEHLGLEPERDTLLTGMQAERSEVWSNTQRWAKTVDFFQRFSKNGQINLEDLTQFVSIVEKPGIENITNNIHKFSPEFQTAETQRSADHLLDSPLRDQNTV